MLEKELLLERDLFFFLNGNHSEIWDNFFYISTNTWTWLVFYLGFLWIFIKKKNRKELVCILLAVGLLMLLCDQIASEFFKPFFHRLRPTHHPDFMDRVKTVYDYRGGPYGFISGHAANNFGLAVFLALIFRNRLFSLTIFLYAGLIAYSRIYIGVHFVSDVVVGAMVGTIIAILIYLLFNRVRLRWLSLDNEQLKKPVCSIKETFFLCSIFYLHIIIILIFNSQLVTIMLQYKLKNL